MWYSIFALGLCLGSARALTCFNCRGISHPRFCDLVTECAADEVCVLQKERKSNGDIAYNTGCMASSMCKTSSSQLCLECCNTNLCNTKGCGETDVVTSNRTICYECSGKLVNEPCHVVKFCEAYETCYIEGKIHFGETFYNSGCKVKHVCGAQYVGNSIIGRREIRQRRSDLQFACCDTSVCNSVSHLNLPNSLTNSTLIPQTTTSTVIPTECADINSNKDGVYSIRPPGSLTDISVFCIMRGNEKWTVIQTRLNGSVDFYRNWASYAKGFGPASGEYWLGNDNIHKISTNGAHELSVYLERNYNKHGYANYTDFSVDGESAKFKLHVSGYRGTIGDSLKRHNNHMFSTYDRDNDQTSTDNCAEYNHGAWWYDSCYDCNLNGKIKTSGHLGAVWETWTGQFDALSKTVMMIKRK